MCAGISVIAPMMGVGPVWYMFLRKVFHPGDVWGVPGHINMMFFEFHTCTVHSTLGSFYFLHILSR